MRLSALISSTPQIRVRALVGADADPLVTSIDIDSRKVTSGALFCCSPGEHSDGHDFASQAVDQGAVALLVDHELRHERRVPQLIVDSTRLAVGHLASEFFGRPSAKLRTIGITGTNGKTTTAHILQCALNALNEPCGVIGTLTGKHTTPEAPDLQRRLAEFVAEAKRSVAMEVSSHALALDRVVGTRFAAGVFTNLGRDHLDLHGTEERYFAAKAKLFTPELCDQAIVNADDVRGRLLADVASIPTTTYSLGDIADIQVGSFEHRYVWHGERVAVGLGGHFNVSNSLAAVTTLLALGFGVAETAIALSSVSAVPGRFEPVRAGQDFTVIVDFAHTPEALTEVLHAARTVAGSRRVLVVFGCGGDRDRAKRPLMALAAATLADRCIITSDNPRSEDPLAIINDAFAGVPGDYRGNVVLQADRHQAIAQAVHEARAGDVVVIAGKGHETTQTIQSTVLRFDDRAVARALLEGML